MRNGFHIDRLLDEILLIILQKILSEVFARITGVRKLFGRRQGISRCWMLSTPYVLISKPECVEVNCAKQMISYFGAWTYEDLIALKSLIDA